MAETPIKNHEYPPNYSRIIDVLGTSNGDILFAYYPHIYNPGGSNVSPDLLLHENIHLEQQKSIGVDEWWKRYLADNQFRYEQELIAFAGQYAYGKKVYKTKISDQMLSDFALLLSGPMYKTGVSYQQVHVAIRRKQKQYAK